ncbi:MAG: T9SS type A sorting domain-containing protein [Bacteroidales bacterium]|nr:T9SS type A sorting domain-containing protein [Bacteroidales bacterium]
MLLVAKPFKILINSIDKLLLKILMLFCILCLSSTIHSQMAGKSSFKMLKEADQRIGLNIRTDKNIQLRPFTDQRKISGLTISASVELYSDSSLVRVILIDYKLNEYLIYEAYPLLTENGSFEIDQTGEETAILDNIIPMSITIETVDASIHLKEIETRGEESFIAKTRTNKLEQQQSEKINKINQYIERKGLKWIAGETSVSCMTYQEKKKMFGGKVPNLQGFEYYRGGIFVLPGVLEENADKDKIKSITQAKTGFSFVKEFSWRNRHGQNWVTSVKNQGGCGSCWAFAVTGATELLVNLYYNQHLDPDLSEQDVLSCSGAGSCAGGSPNGALTYIMDTGIVNESCFPYAANDLPCENKCTNSAEIVRINSKSAHSSEDEKKREIIKGATAATVGFWNHAMTLVGYKVLQEGDHIYLNNNGSTSWITILEDDILIGQTAWLFKNSWGSYWGNDGYVYVVGSIYVYSLHGPVHSVNYNDSDIRCIDQDNDGYYTWGTGLKPAHCPDCPDEPDGDDSDECMGPLDAYGNILSVIPPPAADDVTLCEGEFVPDLTASGENIRWYNDPHLSGLIYSGSPFPTGHTDIGIYTYYVTQNISGCESDPDTVVLSIRPLPPVAGDVNLCGEQHTVLLTAQGENIKWYANPSYLYDYRDNHIYNMVTINDQTWMKENLNFYTLSGSWYYNNDSILYSDVYGRLYNWETAMDVCPDGYRLPSDNDWIDLGKYLGGDEIAGGKMKEEGFLHWNSPNTGATNESGFTALPAGRKSYDSETFWFLGDRGVFWSSDLQTGNVAWVRLVLNGNADLHKDNAYISHGYSVRCMRNISDPIASGYTLKPILTDTGTYVYFVTQTVNDVESPADTVILTIYPVPDAPVSENMSVCENLDPIQLQAEGENVKWYADPDIVSLVDARDGQEYLTVKIGDQWWMAENLNYGIMIGHTTEQTNNEVAEKYCYDNSEENCDTYGGLYQWDEAMDYTGYEVNRGLCPEGWHIPTDREWRQMENYLGMEVSEALSGEWRGTNEGGKLKEESDLYWKEPNTGATNESGFTALPGGTRYLDKEFYNIGSWAYFWTSALEQEEFAWKRNLHSIESRIRRMSADTKESMSVRCIKDDVLLTEGNVYQPEISDTGTISYYVSQSVNGCESNYRSVQLTIKPVPDLPVAENQAVCFGEETPDMFALGENIHWYSDTALTNCIYSGNIFPATQTEPGTYTYYVTQSLEECEGDCMPVSLFIYSLPEVDLGSDTTITDQGSVVLSLLDNESYSYLWSTGSDGSCIEVSGSVAGVGDHTYWLMVTDSNSCENSDTVTVSVTHVNAIPYSMMNRSIEIYPNPGVDILHIQLAGMNDKKLSIEVIDRLGNVLISEQHYADPGNEDLKLNVSVLSPGVYFIRIFAEKIMITKGIVIR